MAERDKIRFDDEMKHYDRPKRPVVVANASKPRILTPLNDLFRLSSGFAMTNVAELRAAIPITWSATLPKNSARNGEKWTKPLRANTKLWPKRTRPATKET